MPAPMPHGTVTRPAHGNPLIPLDVHLIRQARREADKARRINAIQKSIDTFDRPPDNRGAFDSPQVAANRRVENMARTSNTGRVTTTRTRTTVTTSERPLLDAVISNGVAHRPKVGYTLQRTVGTCGCFNEEIEHIEHEEGRPVPVHFTEDTVSVTVTRRSRGL